MNKKAANLSWLEDLNPQQQTAVTYGDGPLLVVAGAGTGKTKTLAYRVAYLIAQGVNPGKILLLTFTRRAAQEMLRRAAHIAQRGSPATVRVWGGTFHATANRLLRIYAKAAGLSKDFTILDQGDAEDLIGLIRHEKGLHNREKRFPRKRTCLAIYSRCVNGSLGLKDVLERYFPWCAAWEEELRPLFKQYVSRKQERNVLDYDDLLLYWVQLVSDEKFANRLSKRFDHILVDEYQDTNKLQAQILLGMRYDNNNIMVVGDDAQSIYGFRGATVRNILDFPKEFPGTTIVKLEQNYRSIAPVLETANLVIAGAKERHPKNLWSDREEGERPKLVTCKDETQQNEYVIQQILRHYEEGIALHKQAVLFRAGHLSDSLELELTRKNIPYHKYGGLRFLEASHVKDLIAFLRLAENPRDEMAWLRVLQLMDGIGPGTASQAIRHVVEHGNSPESIGTFKVRPSARKQMAAFAETVSDLVHAGSFNPALQIERIRRFYDPLLHKLYENPGARSRDLVSLEQIASGYRLRRDFLVDLQLDPPTSTGDLAGPPHREDDWLVLSTIHSAKGCEWDVVYLIHAADGFLPSDMATGSEEEIEEELRLTYVALTRARDFLYISWPLRYYHRWYAMSDSSSYAQPCRFFTDDVMKSLDEVYLEQGSEVDRRSEATNSRDIAERIREMWEE